MYATLSPPPHPLKLHYKRFSLHLIYFLIVLEAPNHYYKIQLVPQILLHILIINGILYIFVTPCVHMYVAPFPFNLTIPL